MIKAMLLSGAALAILATPAYSQGCFNADCTSTITQEWLVSIQASNHGQPPFSNPFPPILVGNSSAHVVGEVIDPGDPLSYYTVYSSVPETIIQTPVTITDSSGDTATFNAVVSTAALAIEVAAYFGAPLQEVAITLTVMTFVADTYGPVSNTIYAGVNNFAIGVINAGISAMNSGAVPIGPDPLFNFDFAIGATTFSGSFDAYGTVNNISGVHDVNLFVDGVPAVAGSAIPEPATWMMLIIGFTGIAWMARRRKATA